MSEGIFRKAALDRLRTPEQLHTLMSVIDAKGWLALLGCGVILVAAIGWSIVGRVPMRVGATGIVLARAGLVEVGAPRDGQIASIPLAAGSAIAEGQLLATLADGSRVSSAVQGRVVEVRAAVGDRVTPGRPLFAVELGPAGGVPELEALLYVDARAAKGLAPGMAVEIAGPRGLAIGRVRSVESYPSTRLGMMSALHNAELVETLLRGAAGPLVAVRADLLRSRATLTSGTWCTASVVTRTRRPLALVFPALDEAE